MKKAVSLILALVLCLSVCGCANGTSQVKQKVRANVVYDGGSEYVSAEEIFNYKSKYMNGVISVTAKVERIDGPYYYMGSKPYFDYFDIMLEDGWTVRVHDEDPIMKSINIGDTVTAKGKIMEIWNRVLICGYEAGRGWNSATTEIYKGN